MQVSYWCLYIWFLTYMLLKIRARTCIIPRLGLILTRQARHLGGRGVWEGLTTPPPPPVTSQLKIYPQQHLPESTILHQFAAKNENDSRGHAHRPHLTRVSHSLNDKYQFKQYLTGDPINLFRKYPSNPNSTLPPPKIIGHGPAVWSNTL